MAEHEVLADLMRGPDAVVAVGGGAVEYQSSRRLLRAARVIYLQVSYDEAMQRRCDHASYEGDRDADRRAGRARHDHRVRHSAIR